MSHARRSVFRKAKLKERRLRSVASQLSEFPEGRLVQAGGAGASSAGP